MSLLVVITRLAAVLAVCVSLLVPVPARGGHLDSGCNVVNDIYRYYYGNDNRNHCHGTGESIREVFLGRAAGDVLGGDKGPDSIKGAHGNDDLNDSQGDGDHDQTCDGNGADYMDVKDGDAKDEIWLVNLDGETDFFERNLSPYDEIYHYEDQCPVTSEPGP